jgi:perosamine synthetase
MTSVVGVYEQQFTEEDAQAAYNAVKSGVLSSFGGCVRELEERFCNFVAPRGDHASDRLGMTCCNGTAALVLALYGLGITRARVAVPACSFAATGFAAIEQQNTLEFIDADPNTWNLDIDDLKQKCQYWLEAGDPIKCVIAVHTYGNPYDHFRLKELAKQYKFKIVEDACEAMGADFRGTKAGNLGDVSVFSFYGNKLIAGGEGGFVLTDDPDVMDRMRLYRGQGQDPNRRFWHLVPGFNYRITNLQAAVILSQLRRVKEIQAQKALVRATYSKWLPTNLKLQTVLPGATHSWWMVSVLGGSDDYYSRTSDKLAAAGIETRPIFPPLPSMPAFVKWKAEAPKAAGLYQRGITLPSGPATKLSDIERICDLLR